MPCRLFEFSEKIIDRNSTVVTCRIIEMFNLVLCALFSSTVISALKHYCKKLIIILNDNEITAANDFLKNDLFENLTNAQNTLVALSP